ncbi:hypothetical protein J7382_16295 [Shimia sp. R11_0]|uniref:hypothetical protein n=1 Tax=Shimia sp. R11_0 TaxID=2821096 RepID=UPI001ADAC0D4|nr:hypothetical protein [Shimia sp. R11_0]MBO9479109.1 hypothetical protein [Shimia sp. R11_0]
MKAAITACALICATASASAAQSLIGTWTCARDTAQSTALSNVTFDANGRLNALVNITFLGVDQEVFAQARYRSDYVFEAGTLSDTAVGASINAFTINGKDARKSDHAERLRMSLLEGAEGTAKVQFTSENYMVISPGGAPINCVRME